MADKPNPELVKIVKQFNEIESYEEKCKFFNDEANYKLLVTIYRPAHFPKLEPVPVTAP